MNLLKKAEDELQNKIQTLYDYIDKQIVDACVVRGCELNGHVITIGNYSNWFSGVAISAYNTLSCLELYHPHLFTKIVNEYANLVTPRVLIKKEVKKVQLYGYESENIVYNIYFLEGHTLLEPKNA